MSSRLARIVGVGVCAVAPFFPAVARAADQPQAPPFSAGVSASAGSLRLEDAVQLALTRNERSRISDLNVVVAEAAVERARTAFLPIVTAVGSDQQHAYAATDRNPNNIGNGSLTVNQPIINASAFALYGQAK